MRSAQLVLAVRVAALRYVIRTNDGLNVGFRR
jgi:hypothetical protein